MNSPLFRRGAGLLLLVTVPLLLWTGFRPGESLSPDQPAQTAMVPVQTEENPVPAGLPWPLILVGPEHPLPEDYALDLTALSNGHSVDSRCYSALERMILDCRNAGLSPVICSSYRSWEKQNRLYSGSVAQYLQQGYSQEEAERAAGREVALPGTSEHQLGLAVDIVDLYDQNLRPSQADTPTQHWLMENSWRYGFILRYPQGKEALTGIIYEPWHYRYVGEEAAAVIFEEELCLEEYLERMEGSAPA